MGKRRLSVWGKQCKSQMIILDKSLVQLGQEVNKTPTYVSAIINGRQRPQDQVIVDISKALQVDPDLYGA